MSALPRHTSFRRFAILLMAPLLVMAPLLAVLFGGLMALALINPAQATVTFTGDTIVNVNEVGDEFGVDYICATDCGGEGDPRYEMTAMSFWTVQSIEIDEIVFDIEIMNTTVDQFGDTNRITQFGVKVLDPDADEASVDNTSSTIALDWDAVVDTTFPTFMTVDLIIFEDDTGDAGLKDGETDTLVLKLENFDSSVLTNGLTLEIFPIKYQGLTGTIENADSWEFAGTLKTIAEPSTLALFGFGLVGLAGIMRRRHRKADAA